MRREAEKAKRWNIAIFCVFALLFAAIAVAIGVYQYRHTYMKAKWDADRENRYKIVGDLLERHPLAGISEGEVVRLLGREDSNTQTSFKMSREEFPPETTLVYYLGVDYVDSCWLVISLDGGAVSDVRLDIT